MADEAEQGLRSEIGWPKIHSLSQLITSQFWCFYDVVSDPKEAILADEAKSEVGVARIGETLRCFFQFYRRSVSCIFSSFSFFSSTSCSQVSQAEMIPFISLMAWRWKILVGSSILSFLP